MKQRGAGIVELPNAKPILIYPMKFLPRFKFLKNAYDKTYIQFDGPDSGALPNGEDAVPNGN